MLAALLCNLPPASSGKGDNPRPTGNIFKPTGLLNRPVKKKPAEQRETLEEILEIKDVVQPISSVSHAPIQTMSLAEIDFEIKYLMTKLYRTQAEDDILIILLIASEA